MKSIHSPKPKIIRELSIMIVPALKCSDASAPVEIICKEADGRLLKVLVTGASRLLN